MTVSQLLFNFVITQRRCRTSKKRISDILKQPNNNKISISNNDDDSNNNNNNF
jgi:hypothetical protein